MRFKASLAGFQSALQKVLPALPRKSTLPVLEHLYFSLQDDFLQVIATDQDITIQTKLQVESQVGGAILIPGRRLVEIIKAIGTVGTMELFTNEDNFEVTIETQNPIGSYTLKGLEHTEYLRIPELLESAKPNVDENGKLIKDGKKLAVAFESDELQAMASNTVYAVSTDEFRPAMNGVLFQFRGTSMNVVATDSFRLVKYTVDKESGEIPEDLDIIVPARTVDVLKRIDSYAIMSFIEARGKKTHVRFDLGDSVFISRLINETFPPYETVIPVDFSFNLDFSQKDLLAAINRVSIMTSTISHQIRVHIENDTFSLTGQDESNGAHGIETLNCDYNGENFELAFNSKFLKDALENMSDLGEEGKVTLKFTEINRPVIMIPKNGNDKLLVLIMPVRVK